MGFTPTRTAVRLSATILLVTSLTGLVMAQRPSLRSASGARPASSSQSTRYDRFTPDRSSQKSGTFTIESFSPTGPVTAGAVISVTFSEDIISSESLDTSTPPPDIFSFTPPIEGVVQWESPRQVRFAPTRALKQGTEYTVRINTLLRSQSGKQLKANTEYFFQTPALSLKGATQQNFFDNQRVSIILAFSDEIKPTDLYKYLSLTSGETPVKWKLQNELPTAAPVIITDPMTTDVLRLILDPGLTGTGGPLGLRNRTEKKVDLNFRMLATQMKGEWSNGSPRLSINFSSPPDPGSAEKHITINPPLKLTYSNNANQLVISGDFEAGQRYTVDVKKGLRGTRDKIVLEPTTLSAWMPTMTPFLTLPENGGYLSTRGRMKLRVRTAAINALSIKARRVFDTNLNQQSNSNGWYSTVHLGRQIAEKTLDLTVVPNKPQITEVDLRDLLGPNATGIYGIEVEGKTSDTEAVDADNNYRYSQPSYRQRTVVNLSNLGLVAKTSPKEVMVFVAGLDTAQPIPDITVTLYSNRYQPLGHGTTDATGMVTIKGLTDQDKDAEPATIIAQNASKTEIALLDLRDTLSGMEQFESTGRQYLHDGYEAYITPERGAYRPGETIHITGFIRGRDAAPPPAAFPVEVALTPPDGKTMTPEIHTPSPSGLLDFTMTIPDYAPTGYYDVEVRMPGSANTEDDNDYDY